MKEKLDPDERILEKLFQQINERILARELKEHDDKLGYDTYSK